MPSRKTSLLILAVLTLVNGVIFFLRDHFQYQPYASYAGLYAPCEQDCREKWSAYARDYPASELAEAKQIADSLWGDSTPTTALKIRSIAKFVYERFRNRAGNPAPALLAASPLTQFHQLSASDTVALWCGNFAQIFSYLCWSEGIVCRNLEIMHPGDHHVLNECYLPETGRWAMVDVTNNVLMVRGHEQYLNFQEVKDSLARNAVLMAWQLDGNTQKEYEWPVHAAYVDRYYRPDDPAYYYHRMDNSQVYTAPAKTKRYFLPVSWYDIFDRKNGNNLLFYLKDAFILVWLIWLFVFIIGSRKSKT